MHACTHACMYVCMYVCIIYPMDPSAFLGSTWNMIWGAKYMLRQRLDP